MAPLTPVAYLDGMRCPDKAARLQNIPEEGHGSRLKISMSFGEAAFYKVHGPGQDPWS